MNVAIGAAICAFSCAIIGFSMGLATSKAVESIARQPEAAGKINTMLLLGLALTESCAIYAFVTGLIMMFTL